jgi:hypothetical protein
MGDKVTKPSGGKGAIKTLKYCKRGYCGCGPKRCDFYCDDADFLIPKNKSLKKTKGFREKQALIPQLQLEQT